MAFDRLVPETIQGVGEIRIEISSFAVDDLKAKLYVHLLDAGGNPQKLFTVHDLVAHLTPGQISAITDFVNNIRARAVSEVLPT